MKSYIANSIQPCTQLTHINNNIDYQRTVLIVLLFFLCFITQPILAISNDKGKIEVKSDTAIVVNKESKEIILLPVKVATDSKFQQEDVTIKIIGGTAEQGKDFLISSESDPKFRWLSVRILAEATDNTTIVFADYTKDSIINTRVVALSQKPKNPNGLYSGVGASLALESESPFFLGGFYGDVRLAVMTNNDNFLAWGLDAGIISALSQEGSTNLAGSYFSERKVANGTTFRIDTLRGTLKLDSKLRTLSLFVNNLFAFTSNLDALNEGSLRGYVVLPRVEVSYLRETVKLDTANIIYSVGKDSATSEPNNVQLPGTVSNYSAGMIAIQTGLFIRYTTAAGLDLRLTATAGISNIFDLQMYQSSVMKRSSVFSTNLQLYLREPIAGISISGDAQYLDLVAREWDKQGFAGPKFIYSINIAKSFNLSSIF